MINSAACVRSAATVTVAKIKKLPMRMTHAASKIKKLLLQTSLLLKSIRKRMLLLLSPMFRGAAAAAALQTPKPMSPQCCCCCCSVDANKNCHCAGDYCRCRSCRQALAHLKLKLVQGAD